MNLQELSMYLESREGLLASGIGWSLVLCFGAAYVCYYLRTIAKKPQLITGNENFCQFLQDQCPVLTEIYYPTVWCWEGHLQTLLRPFITSKPNVQYRNELITATDGGQISMDWFDNHNSIQYPDSSTRPTILLLPGLTGTSKESYILHMIQQSKTLGYSMLLLNYLGKTGKRTPLKAAAVFSAGWNAFESADSLEKPVNWLLFNYYLTSCLKSSVTRHRQVFDKLFNMNLVMKAKTIREFDKQFTTVMFGYPSVEAYYEDASPCHKLKKIGIPVLCLNSLDDAFSPNHAIPVEIAKQNTNIALILTSCGGHIGFLEGLWPRKCTYMDRIFKQFVQAVFEHGRKIVTL
ncbi:phospholipase ABHD3 isoform X2 [Protobothrops mucrosquamatus]|uniref:phospholipase ABHD3 isoform X2 n=1 Tax=Protobothrops mucrosquamatus TaxID=103944 RepID=UPI0007758CE2|nr:phospholipase ABHD3 isoform X2 [Protobothrops mucrosquamatus]